MIKVNAIVYIDGIKFYMGIDDYCLKDSLCEYPQIELKGALIQDNELSKDVGFVLDTKALEESLLNNEKMAEPIEDEHEQAIDTLYNLKDIYCQKCPIDHKCNDCQIYQCIKVLDNWYIDRPISQPFSKKSAINQLILFSLVVTDENKKAKIFEAIDFLRKELVHEEK